MAYYVIAESTYGEHHKFDHIDGVMAFSYAYTFIPSAKDVKSFNLPKSDLLEEIANKWQEGDYVFIAFDADLTGELMARVVRDYFMEKIGDEWAIVRTPLIEGGYIAMADFISDEELQDQAKISFLQRKFMGSLKSLKLPMIGFRKALVLDELVEIDKEDKSEFRVEHSGSCTASYVLHYGGE
jgi:hypothetical protein